MSLSLSPSLSLSLSLRSLCVSFCFSCFMYLDLSLPPSAPFVSLYFSLSLSISLFLHVLMFFSFFERVVPSSCQERLRCSWNSHTFSSQYQKKINRDAEITQTHKYKLTYNHILQKTLFRTLLFFILNILP